MTADPVQPLYETHMHTPLCGHATGDPEDKVIEVAGEPVRKVEVQNVYGALRGYRFDYVQGRKTVQIYIAHGQVVHIEEIF